MAGSKDFSKKHWPTMSQATEPTPVGGYRSGMAIPQTVPTSKRATTSTVKKIDLKEAERGTSHT